MRLIAQFCFGKSLAPTFDMPPDWMSMLAGQKILVISPFEKTILNQPPKMSDVWKARGFRWEAEVEVARFPYLIDDSCQRSWGDFFSEFQNIIKHSDSNLVLCGCGGLGLLLASEAKSMGKVGLHIGGFLQLLFGIYGKRYLKQEWHHKYFNEAWTRPLLDERAERASRVEGGCYW